MIFEKRFEHQNSQEILEMLSQMSLSIWRKIKGVIIDRILIPINLVEIDLIKIDSAVGTTSMAVGVVEEEVINLHVTYVENMDSQL